ncbi:MAG: hypothetical protein JRD43_00700 [Deltaproteobacteria bacterium]|nr:hypothetical protein [Deltaproteobacteria bacterium]MBW2595061.1 hypothetical protein [Deltaproteobacteria bacterium]MBW2651229.1 hypothetical protein [Deltaproteobacteria bacterium]
MAEEDKKEFTYRYVYPSDLRDLYVNGAWGGTTPRREIHLHFYSERQPIPKKITHEFAEDGKINEIAKSVEIGGDVVRLIQTSMTMDLDTAIRTRALLDQFIKGIQDRKKGK